ncbi:MAG: hypothetical protein ACI9LG_002478 [Moritella dasanensis]|jgi:hypothetical protein
MLEYSSTDIFIVKEDNLMNAPSVGNNVIDEHAKLLISSYYRLTGKNLIEDNPLNRGITQALFNANLVVVSHGNELDPIFNYGNKLALQAFELSWSDFTALPSRLSAKPLDRNEREDLLARVTKFGFIDDYRGLRISSTGRTFWIEGVTVWNVIDEDGVNHGQAATFNL